MTIELKGHLDTSRATDVKKEIEMMLAKADESEHLVIDCSELAYISSSGLRVLLAIMKKHNDMEIINVSAEIYNVFDMTGFTRIFNISKSLRKIDVSKYKKIGEGGNGVVYKINDEEIVKVSKHAKGEDSLVKENNLVKEAFLMGVPTVISFDTVDVGNDHKGIVMEALDSEPLGEFLTEDPSRMHDIAKKYVDLFKQTNAIKTDMPLFRNIKEWLRSHLTLPQRIIDDEGAALLASIIEEIPDSNHFIHFDGHIGNVLMYGAQDDRNLMLIDLGDAGIGHPVLEISGWAFMMLEPDYAKGCTVAERITGISQEKSRDFCRYVLAEMFHVTDSKELDTIMYKASLIGRIKAVFISQRWASITPDEKFRDYIYKFVKETLTLVPEIKDALRFFLQKMNVE